MNRAAFINPARTNPEIQQAQDRLRGLACDDRPGDPWAVPFDARPGAARFWIRTTLQAVSVSLFILFIWSGLA